MSSRRFCQKAVNHLGDVVRRQRVLASTGSCGVRLIIDVKFRSNDHVWQVEFGTHFVHLWQRGRFAANESQLAEVATDSLTHSDESTVDVAGRRAHSSSCRQGNQGNNQQILDQSLASLVVVKSLQQSEHSAQVVIVPLQKSKGHWNKVSS